MNKINDYKNWIYDNEVYNNEMITFKNNNYNNKVIAPNDSISVLSVLESSTTNSNTNLNTNLNTNSNTNSSTNSSNNSNTNSSNTIITTATSTYDFLAVPATSVASEQIFSCTSCIIDDYCTSLDSDT
ncbi:45750_t:CDS:2, partial [Gigaspora margarita]